MLVLSNNKEKYRMMAFQGNYSQEKVLETNTWTSGTFVSWKSIKFLKYSDTQLSLSFIQLGTILQFENLFF